MNPLSVALALVVAALVGATALLGIVRDTERPAQLPAPGRGRRRVDGFPDRPRGHRPMHRPEPTALDGWPLVTVAVVCSAVVVGMLAALAAGPVSRGAAMFSDVFAVLLGWAA